MYGFVPRMNLSCALSRRTKAKNAIANVRRAVRMRNCLRAERILDAREFTYATQCVSFATLARLHRMVRACRETGRAA